MASDLVPSCIEALNRGLRFSGILTLARVPDTARATDLAVALDTNRLAVVRCVDLATLEDHTALATMLSEGPFVWAALVCEHGDAPPSPGLIESFHVSELDRLVARLVELRGASG